MALNAKQRLFVREYIKDRNGARAYRAVYGCAESAAAAAASRALTNVNVQAAIQKALAKLETKLEISAERTLARLAEFAYQPLTSKELKNSAGMNALRANELLAKHFKLLTDLHEHAGKDGGPVVILSLPANGSEANASAPQPNAQSSSPPDGDESGGNGRGKTKN